MSLETIKKMVNGGETWKNDRGGILQSAFLGDLDRYYFDFKVCTKTAGWNQFDTDQDAPYFGVWYNIKERAVVTWCEGDLMLVAYSSEDGFWGEIEAMKEYYGVPPAMARVITADGELVEYYDKDARPSREG